MYLVGYSYKTRTELFKSKEKYYICCIKEITTKKKKKKEKVHNILHLITYICLYYV